MLQKLYLYLLGQLSENLDDIIDMFAKLDARLDKYLEAEAKKQSVIVNQIETLDDQLVTSIAATERAARTQARVRALTE